MKRILSLLLLILSPLVLRAQAPEMFKYQSIARDAGGLVMPNSLVGLRISIHNSTPTGTIVFQETHNAVTNDFGLFTLSIGAGVTLVGDMASVDWANGAKYIEIEADLTGGTNYQGMGTSQLLSVPYALYAKSATSAGSPILPNGTAIGNTSFWDGSTWVVDNNNIYNAGMYVGIGTGTPLQRLHVDGNINIPLDSAFMIDNRRLLWIDGNNINIGENAGSANTFGTSNTYLGYDAGGVNVVGSQNTYLGTETGSLNTVGNMGTFVGNRAGLSNTVGNENTFVGAYAGQFNTEGQHNTFLGVTTGSLNTLGSENTFLGAHAGYFNIDGSYNTFVGNFSGEASGSGNFNTLLGFEADMTTGNLQNSMALGYGAIVSADNNVIIGNTAVTSIGGQVGWSTFSDGRLKTNIEQNQLGLEFINQLSTVNYEYIAEGQAGIRYSGLIAQDVVKTLEELGREFSGVVPPANEESYYSLRYSEFVIPLIKATQEQTVIIDSLESRIKELEDQLEILLKTEKK